MSEEFEKWYNEWTIKNAQFIFPSNVGICTWMFRQAKIDKLVEERGRMKEIISDVDFFDKIPTGLKERARECLREIER